MSGVRTLTQILYLWRPQLKKLPNWLKNFLRTVFDC